MKRLSDAVAAMVTESVERLEILESDREAIDWEVVPFVAMDSSVGWVVGIGLPVPLTGDSIMPFAVIQDPHGRDEIERTVRALYEAAASQVADVTAKITAQSNGHGKTTPGGLIVP